MANAHDLRSGLCVAPTWQPAVYLWITLATLANLACIEAFLAAPTFFPDNGKTDMPLKDFSILLTFQETVQAGVSTFGVGNAIITVKTDDGNVVETMSCLIGPHYVGRNVVLPIATGSKELASNARHTFHINGACFANQAGEPLAAALDTYSLYTIAKGTNFLTNDVTSPTGLPLASPAGASWVSASQSFALYFSEAVQQGDSSVIISRYVEEPTGKVLRIYDNAPTITFSRIPGEVLVKPKTLATGLEYEIIFGSNAFKDIAGNYVMRSSMSLPYSPYWFKVSANIVSKPSQGSTALVPSANLVFRFSDPVMPGMQGVVSVCQGWSTLDPCLSPATVPLSRMLFLGDTVIMNPAADLRVDTQYNISIPDTVIRVFHGVADGLLGINVTDYVDGQPPRLVAARVDCNGDGDLVGTGDTSDACDADQDQVPEFVEVSSVVNESTPILVGARFKLYFDRRVKIKVGGVAHLLADDGTLVSVAVALSPTMDSTVELSPTLTSGSLFELSIAAGVITDASTAANEYPGITLSFYTPMPPPTFQPATPTVTRTTAIKLTFQRRPQLGKAPLVLEENLNIAVNDIGANGSMRSIALDDLAQVKFQGNDILVIMQPPLSAGRTYYLTLPKQSVRYMTREFSFNFSTLAEDTRKPEIIAHYPTGETLKTDLDAIAPWFLFSEGVRATAGKQINFKEDGVLKYTISSDDISCGAGGTSSDACVQLDARSKKITLYPLGRVGASPTPWAFPAKTYTIEFDGGAFSDALTTGVALANPMFATSFTFNAVAVAQVNSAGVLAFVGFQPANMAKWVPTSFKLVLSFAADVKRGSTSGIVRFCLNSNASLASSCDPGHFADGTIAELSVNSATFTLRSLTLHPPQAFQGGQILYILMPAGVATDTSTQTKLSPALQNSDYFFHVGQQDTVRPFLNYYEAPKTGAGPLRLFFSEAIQASSGAVKIMDVQTQAPVTVQTATSGNEITVTKSWTAGRTYGISFVEGGLKDLAGNVFGYPYDGTEFQSVQEPENATTGCTTTMTTTSTTDANDTTDAHESTDTIDATVICDDVSPIITHMSPAEGAFELPPISSAVVIGVYFSEPVRIAEEIQIMKADNSIVPSSRSPYLIYGNGVAIPIPPQALLGHNFTIHFAEGAIVDTAGNSLIVTSKTMLGQAPLVAATDPSNVVFSILSDVTDPLATLVPVPPLPLHWYDTLAIQFNEVVQFVSGKVSLHYQDPPECLTVLCRKQAMEAEVSTLPVVSSTIHGTTMAAGGLASLVFVSPGVRLFPGRNYTLSIPSGAYKDLAGNFFAGLATNNMRTTTMKKDNVKPVLRAVDMGAGVGTPNPSFVEGSVIKLYFSEVVKLGLSGSAKLEASNGGNSCNSDTPGACLTSGATCSSPCGYSPAPLGARLTALFNERPLQGTVVSLTVFDANLAVGQGYKLIVDAGTFEDLAGNTNDAINGELLGYVLRTSLVNSSVAPKLVSMWPSNGSGLVPLSTAVRMTFDQHIQHGQGSIQIGSQTMPCSSCHVQSFSMTCMPPQSLHPKSTYAVNYSSCIAGLSGTLASPLIFSFTTIDMGYTSPALIVPPVPNETLVAKGQMVALTFSQAVQMGSGNIVISGCTPGVNTTIDVASPLNSGCKLYPSGNHVYIDQPDCEPGMSYSVTTSDIGVFKDVFGLSLAKLESGFVFSVVPEDATPLQVYQSFPPVQNTNEVYAPNTAVTLYLSEAVQNVGDVQGLITVNGNIVRLQPSIVQSQQREVKVAAGAFTDLSGTSAIGDFDLSFSVQPNVFTQETADNEIAPFPPREGAVMYYINSSLMIYGGRDGAGCKGDLWSSVTGALWNSTATTNTTNNMGAAPKVAYAPTAIDKHSCVWLLGGECNHVANMWKSCNAGVTWYQLPIPSVVPEGQQTPQPWPTAWSGHSITIVGGWQLVIVDAAKHNEGCVWKSLDAKAEFWRCVTIAPFPFGQRRDPALMATADNALVLLGGHNCNDHNCSNMTVLFDVWKSYDMGFSWHVQTQHYLPMNQHLESEHSKGLARYMSVLVMSDDTIFVMAGSRANSSRGSNLAFASTSVDADTEFLGVVLLSPQKDAQDVARIGLEPTLYFREGVQRGSGDIMLLDLSTQPTSNVPIMISVVNQSVTLMPNSMLEAGRRYRVQVSQGAIGDYAGNLLTNLQAADASYYFKTSFDTVAPTVVSICPNTALCSLTNVPVSTTFNLELSDGPVIKGVGDLMLSLQDASTISSKFGFTINYNVTWTKSNADIPVGTQGTVLGFTGNNVNVKFSAGTFPMNPVELVEATLIKSKFGFMINDLVKWKLSSIAVPSGTQGTVLGFPDDCMRVKFPSGTLTFNPEEMVKAAIQINIDDAVILGTKVYFSLPGGVQLLAGAAYRVDVPLGILADAVGNKVLANQATFTTLPSDTDDRTSPMIVAASSDVEQTLEVYFSESVQAGSGDIVVSDKDKRPLVPDIMVAVRNASIAGGRLTIPFTSLIRTVEYELTIPAGSFKDMAGNVFAGISGGAFTFSTSIADLMPPELLQQDPRHESSHDFMVPTTSPLLLTFNEAVQAAGSSATSEIHFVPLYDSETITVPASKTVIEGNKVFVMPSPELKPGEVYTIMIGSTAFKDLKSNFYADPNFMYAISTSPLMKFEQAGEAHWAADGFNGERYGMAAAIAPGNQIFIAGGRRADGMSDGWLNDVWSFDTKRETHCASSVSEPAPCSLSKCETDPSNKSSLGTRMKQTVIWRAPSAGGELCQTPNGSPRSQVGDVLISLIEECPCPLCVSGPDGMLPANMVNTDYLTAYAFLPADSSPQPLLCTNGYVSTGAFKCVVHSPFLGRFQKPYPACEPAPCDAPPPSIPQFQQFVPEKSTGNLDCAMLNSSSPMPHQGNCAMACKPGWNSNGNFTCEKGSFTAPTCVQQECQTSENNFPEGINMCGKSSIKVSQTCAFSCSAGYRLFVGVLSANEVATGVIDLTCHASSSEAESKPMLHYSSGFGGSPICKKNVCKAMYTMPGGENALFSFPLDLSIGVSVKVNCSSGYAPVITHIHCFPVAPTEPGNPAADWRNASGSIVPSLCRKLECSHPTDPHGTYKHALGVGTTAVWELHCNPGWNTLSSDRYARCSSAAMIAQKPEPCVFVGGCNSSIYSSEDALVNGSTCRKWMEEGETCRVICNAGQVVGQFTCVMMQVAGLSQCAPYGAETHSVTMLAGSFSMDAQLPAGANVQSGPFQDLLRGSLAEGLGVWPTDLNKFTVTLMSSSTQRLLGGSRRLSSFNFDVSYELIVRDLANLGSLQRDLNNLGSPDSLVILSFSRTLMAHGVVVRSIVVTRAPTHFQGTILVQQLSGSQAVALGQDDDEDNKLNTSTIAGGFIGAMMGLTLVTIVLYILTRQSNAKALADKRANW